VGGAMSPLRVYRDDGALASVAGRFVRLPFGALPLTAAGALPLLAVLVFAGGVPAAGLVAVAFLVAVAGAARSRAERGRLAWLVPPLLRALEYGILLWLTDLADADALPACFALLGVLAFHHYDTVYRLKHQGVAPPTWLRIASGGWDGRLVVVYALAAADALEPVLAVLALALGVLFVSESVVSWLGAARAEGTPTYIDEDLEDA
ncbi:MAG TPA: DUF5941 domain-containing protein, partial [Solirubrobacter sp.]|nr:DUF5941 domain-containing protein [Solirubrobacter sp.]